MMRLLIGVAAGYVLGTKAGRARYEQISRAAKGGGHQSGHQEGVGRVHGRSWPTH